MVKVNLLTKDALEKNTLGKFLAWTLSYGRYIIISVELVVFLVFFSRFFYDQQLADLHDTIEQKQAIVASAADFERTIRDIQNRIKQVKSLDRGRLLYMTALDDLKQIMPTSMNFSELRFEKDQ